jgi:hypothetical protein
VFSSQGIAVSHYTEFNQHDVGKSAGFLERYKGERRHQKKRLYRPLA